MLDINKYLNKGIRNLTIDALKISAKQPSAFSYFRRLKGYIEQAEKKRGNNLVAGMHVPPFLIASITSSCNLYCSGCYARANGSCGDAVTSQLDTDRWSEIFSEARELGISFILLAGGEPLMRRDVIEAAAKFPEIVFPVFTNGTMIDQEYIDLFAKYRNLIPVLSIEGSKETTDRRRGQGIHDKLNEAMSRLLDSSIFYGASVTVTKDNLHEISDLSFAANLKERGCSLMFFVEYVPSDGKSSSLAPTDFERAILSEQVDKIREKVRMVILSFPGDEDAVGGCLAAGRGFFHINASGSAEPCPFSPYSDMSLKDNTITEVLASPLFKALRDNKALQGAHDGGCLLWEKREYVSGLVNDSNAV